MTADLQPYPAMKDPGVEWLGKVPAHWEIERLKCSLANIVEQAGELPQMSTVVALENVESWTGRVALADSGLMFDSQLKRFRSGDVLFGKLRPYLAKVARLTSSGLCVGEFLVLRPRHGNVMGPYFEYLLRSKPFIDAVTASTYGAKMPRADWRFIGGMPVVRPPLAEQASIVRFLDHTDRRIRRYIRAKEKLIVLLEESRTALITRAVTRGLDQNAGTHSTRSHVFPLVPDRWTLWKVRRLIRRVRRPVVVRRETEYREIGIRSWGKGIFHKDPVRGAMLGEKSVFRIEPGDFVLNIVFAWEGAVSVVSENETGMIASHRFPTFRPSPDVDLDYLLMVFQSEQGRRLMELNSPGAAGRNKTLRVDQFLDEEVPLPTVDSQKAIVAAVRDEERRLADSAAKSRQAVQHLKEFRTATIAAAVTGKLDVREAAAGLPEVDPLAAEGDSVDGVDHEAGSERTCWRHTVEEDGPLADVSDAYRSEAAVAGSMTERR